MGRSKTHRLLALVLLLAAAPAFAADAAGYSVKQETVAPPKELKEPIRNLLDDKALVVSDGKSTLCTIWFRKEIPSKATAQQVKNGLTYREVQQTTLVGAIRFPKRWADYRKQEIPAGVYTLRYALQPQDGDHMGTAPFNDFLLLAPADKDAKPDPMEVKAMRELSAITTGGNHPAVLLLYPNNKPGDAPKVVERAKGTFVVDVKRPVGAGAEKAALGFGLTVVGHTTSE